MNSSEVVFKFDDGRIYDVEQSCFVEEANPLKKVLDFHVVGDADPIEFFKIQLEYFGFPIGAELMTFDEKKEAKLDELSETVKQKLEDLFVETSIGYAIDANTDSLVNIENLLEADVSPVEFMLHDNTTAELTLDQLAAIKPELFAARQELYQKKWDIRDAINECETEEELAAITWDENLNLSS